jgi:Protein of unknown function (DUF2950)
VKGGKLMISAIVNKDRDSIWSAVLVMAVAAILIMCTTLRYADAGEIKQNSYASPEEAVKALMDAVKSGNQAELLAVLGPESEELISSGDEVADKAARENFVSGYEEKNELEKEGPDKVVLSVGQDNWPLPIPIVKKDGRWVFDTQAGKEELLNRRIGRNELNTIDVMHAFVDAEREYVSKDRNGDGATEFAQKIISTSGEQDGLYWEPKEGGEESPFGPLIAEAAKGGYKYTEKKTHDVQPSPYHGYFFKILKGQGPNAQGGQYDYVVNGKMILGYGLVAYPASYGSSGIMTFIINQDDVVYQKDLGEDTAKVAESISTYDPDKTWTKVGETDEVPEKQ